MSASRMRKRVRVGIALSGGGARGLAQVGVLKLLERAGVSVDVIAGTSFGAIIGGVYACWPDAAELEKRVLAFVRSKYMESLNLATIRRLGGILPVGEAAPHRDDPGLFDRVQTAFRGLYASHLALSRRAVLSGRRVQRVLETVFGSRTFEDTEIPFGAVAVDLKEGCEVIIGSGPLARGVAASSAIPGIFPPVELNGRLLCDGGYTSPVPIDAVKTLGANVAIAVDVSQHGIAVSELANGVEIAMRSSEISLMALEQEQLRRADVVISARGQKRHWSDFSDPEEAIRAGEVACEKLLDNIRDVVEERARLFL
ncbi:MAG: patatin-like phospholipase family protein [Acidobacteria bacterium]|nr:patatin-like phospholipase family protein [Acidobacteriota bacterium]